MWSMSNTVGAVDLHRNGDRAQPMPDDETLALRVTVIGGKK